MDLIPNGMIHPNDLTTILEHLDAVLQSGIDGAVVEFGCYEGTTSLFIAQHLVNAGNKRSFHVYDSFQGLPAKEPEDGSSDQFLTGSCSVEQFRFEANFRRNNLPTPVIHAGWFKDLTPADLPEQIAFAFLDGDFYSSIFQSLSLVYPRLTDQARVLIHDYGYEKLPGVEKACADFLAPKKMHVTPMGGVGLFIMGGQ